MGINWKVRVQSKPFWVSVFALLGLILTDASVIDAGTYDTYVQAVMLVLITAGVVVDPTTDGVKDSRQALTYDKPRKDDV